MSYCYGHVTYDDCPISFYVKGFHAVSRHCMSKVLRSLRARGEYLSRCCRLSTSLVQAELRAVVQTHVRVTEQPAGGLLEGWGVNSAKLLLWQVEVAAHLRTRLHLGDVEAILATCVRAESEPCSCCWLLELNEDVSSHLPGQPYCQKTASRWGGARAWRSSRNGWSRCMSQQRETFAGGWS